MHITNWKYFHNLPLPWDLFSTSENMLCHWCIHLNDENYSKLHLNFVVSIGNIVFHFNCNKTCSVSLVCCKVYLRSNICLGIISYVLEWKCLCMSCFNWGENKLLFLINLRTACLIMLSTNKICFTCTIYFSTVLKWLLH